MGLLHKKFSKLFLPQIFFIVQRKRKCQEDETSEKFTSMSCFLHALSTTKASRKSIFNCVVFFFFLFIFMTAICSASLSNCHLPFSNGFQFPRRSWEGASLPGVPPCQLHAHGLGSGLNSSLYCLTFLSYQYSPSWKCFS